MEFKPIDKEDYNDNELWTMVKDYPFKSYPDSLDEGEFINLYTCDEYPEYLMGYGKIIWNSELCDFTLIRNKIGMNILAYDEFTTYSSPIDEEKAFDAFAEYLKLQ